MITHIASESVYCTTKRRAVNGLSRLTTTSNGLARPITFDSNQNGRFEFESRSFAFH